MRLIHHALLFKVPLNAYQTNLSSDTAGTNMTISVLHRIRHGLTAALAVVCLNVPIIASADDPEVFFANPDVLDSSAANVMFVMDNSGTMTEYDDSHLRRIDRLKQAVSEMINDTRGINIGLGTFSGRNWGGNVLYPVTNPNKDICENQACDAIEVDTRVTASADDAFEAADGAVSLTSDGIYLGNTDAPATVNELLIAIADDEDDVEEFPNGGIDDESSSLNLFNTNGSSPVLVGLRFKNVSLPAGIYE